MIQQAGQNNIVPVVSLNHDDNLPKKITNSKFDQNGSNDANSQELPVLITTELWLKGKQTI